MSTSPLKAVLTACLPEHAPELFAYHLDDDFASLWSMQPCFGPVVIVWTETPPDPELAPVRCQNNLSPIDWAVTYAATHKTWPKILVLDLQPDFNTSAPLYRRFLEMRPGLIPWLQVLPPKDISLRIIHEILSAGAPTIGPDQREAHASLLRDVRMTLSEGGPKAEADRHAIANIIAPMILRDGKAKHSLHSAALHCLLRATGLTAPPIPTDKPESQAQAPEVQARPAQAEPSQGTPGATNAATPSIPSPQPTDSTTETGAGMHVLLLDDQANQGWADWVQDCLPAAKVSAATDPAKLVQAVAEQLKDPKTKDLRFRLKLPNLGECMHPVLLLDLRLFSGKPTEELNFYKSLLPLITRFTNRKGLAWPAFFEKDKTLNDAIKAVNDKTLKLESPEHHEALTWLPRILALADKSLPIILFSSTSRSSVLKRLSGCGNIITDFQKPSLSSGALAQDIIEAARRGFLRAVKKAKGVQGARAALSLIRLSERTSSKTTSQSQVATIFVDESGDLERSDLFALGAFVVIGSDHTTADSFSSVLEQSDLVWGFSESSYFPPPNPFARNWTDEIIRQIPADFLPKNAAFDEDPEVNRRNQAEFGDLVGSKLEAIEGCATTAQVDKCAAAAFVYDISRSPRPNTANLDLSNIADLDILYRNGLRDLLRFLFTQWPPIAKPLSNGTLQLRVEVATRELKANILASPPYRDELIKKYAARLRCNDRNEWGLVTLAGPEVFPLVSGILADLGLPLASISGARAVILHDYDSVRWAPGRMKIEESLPLQAHYIADWVAKFACKQRRHIPRQMLRLYRRGFLQECSEAFRALWLEVDRGTRHGRRVDAICNLAEASLLPESALHNGESAELYLREIASAWERKLTGADLTSLFRRMMYT